MFLHMVHHLGKACLQDVLEDLLVDHDADHATVIIEWQLVLSHVREHPEGLFLGEVLDYFADDKVHPLTVADGRVALDEGAEYFP